MSDIYQHLGLKRDIFDHFALQASLVVDNRMKSDLERHTRVLMKITERYLTDSEAVASKDSIDKVLLKIKRLSELHDETCEWSLFELRIISYNLGALQDSTTAFRYAVQMLDKHWRNLFFGGITFYVLNNWLASDATKKDAVCELLKRKLEEYDGDNRRVLSLKNHANYFDSNGPLRLSTLLSQRNKFIMEAPEILGYKENAISFSYFSNVILEFFSRKGTIDIPTLEKVLTFHTLDRTKKLALAKFVELAEKGGNEYVQTEVSKFSQRILGDIALASTWTPFPNASNEEKEQLLHAQSLVNQWNARKAINSFFELCVQDERRKGLWLKYVPFIYDFRIIGSKATKTKLLGDERVCDLINYYYITTRSSRRQTSSLVLYIKNKVFVEFSDKGALYVYNMSNPKISEIRKGKAEIEGVDDLKIPSINLLIDNFEGAGNWYSGYESQSWIKYHDEGRLLHSDYWRERINAYMRQKLKIDFKRPQDFSSLPSNNEYNDSTETSYSYNNQRPFAYSKWIFNNMCRVEAYNDGFYLRISNSNKLTLIASMDYKPNGSIWIKKDKDYREVYYHVMNEDKYLGFLSLWNFSNKEIRFHPLYNDNISIPID